MQGILILSTDKAAQKTSISRTRGGVISIAFQETSSLHPGRTHILSHPPSFIPRLLPQVERMVLLHESVKRRGVHVRGRGTAATGASRRGVVTLAASVGGGGGSAAIGSCDAVTHAQRPPAGVARSDTFSRPTNRGRPQLEAPLSSAAPTPPPSSRPAIVTGMTSASKCTPPDAILFDSGTHLEHASKCSPETVFAAGD